MPGPPPSLGRPPAAPRPRLRRAGGGGGPGSGAAARWGRFGKAWGGYACGGPPPAEVVSRLDRLVHGLEQGRMATLLYMVLEADLGSVKYSIAGHLPPLLLGS